MPKYNSINNIPSKIFFEILKTKNYELLEPKRKTLVQNFKHWIFILFNKSIKIKSLEEVFMSIYDDFFLQSDNYEAKEYLRITNEIACLEYKKATLKQLLHFYLINQHTEQMRIDFAKFLKDKYKTELDLTKDFLTEMHSILTIQVGYIDNDLVLLRFDFDRMIKENKSNSHTFFDELANLGQILQGNNLIKDDVTLAVYVSLMKVAKKKVEQQNKK